MEELRDRRASVRLPATFDVELTDHYYRWEARGLALSADGCAVRLAADFAAGKELEAHFAAAWGAPSLSVHATVVHVTHGVVGLDLDVSRAQTYEAMLDRVDRLALSKPQLGVYAAHAVRRLDAGAVLSAGSALAAVAVSEPERRFLKELGPGRTLGEVARALGPAWQEMRHVPFALLQRGLVRRGGVSRPPPGTAATVAEVAQSVHANVRPPQADRYVHTAVILMQSGDRKQARLNLRLALALAPKDAEIELLLEQLGDD